MLKQWFENNRANPEFLRVQEVDIDAGTEVFGFFRFPDWRNRVYIDCLSKAVASEVFSPEHRIDWI